MKRFVVAVTIAILIVIAYVADAQVQVWNGDLDGSTNANKIVTGLLSKPLPSLSVGALSYDGGSWYFDPSSVSIGLAGQALFTNDAGTAKIWAYPHGDVDASATDPGALTVNAIQGFGISNAVPSSGNALVYSSGLWRPNPINLGGGSASVTGTLPTSNQAAQTLGGDLSGTTSSGQVRLASTSSHIDMGGTVATSGGIRSANNTVVLTARDSANSVNIALVQTDSANNVIIGDGPHYGSNVVLSSSGSVSLNAVGGWVLNWNSGGELAGTAGNITMGTHGSNSFTTTLEAGNAVGIATMSATSGVGSEFTTWKGAINYATTTAPGTPSSGMTLYVDNADGKFKAKDSSGNIFVLAP